MSTAVAVATAVAVSNGGQAVANSGSPMLAAWYGPTMIGVILFGFLSYNFMSLSRSDDARMKACFTAMGWLFFTNFWYAYHWTEPGVSGGLSLLSFLFTLATAGFIVDFAGWLEKPIDVEAAVKEAEEKRKKRQERWGRMFPKSTRDADLQMLEWASPYSAGSNLFMPSQYEIQYAKDRPRRLPLSIIGFFGSIIVANVLIFAFKVTT